MKASDFEPGQKVTYIPRHANGDLTHKECEHGTVSASSTMYVFVRFDAAVVINGWENTLAQACHPQDLIVREVAS